MDVRNPAVRDLASGRESSLGQQQVPSLLDLRTAASRSDEISGLVSARLPAASPGFSTDVQMGTAGAPAPLSVCGSSDALAQRTITALRAILAADGVGQVRLDEVIEHRWTGADDALPGEPCMGFELTGGHLLCGVEGLFGDDGDRFCSTALYPALGGPRDLKGISGMGRLAP